MSTKLSKGLFLWAALVGLAFPAACGSSGVVGGECSASYVSCDGQCVDAQNDPANCGGCKRACDPGVACQDAICQGTLGGGAGSSSGGNSGSSGDAGTGGDAGFGNALGTAGDDDPGHLSDASPDGDAACLPPYNRATACGDCQTACTGAKPVCSPDGMGSYVCEPKCKGALVECDGQCVDPATFDSADSCGECDAKCSTSAPTCSPDGSGGHQCVLICDDPLKACDGKCVDYNIDANNCGSCENACDSSICQSGMCVGGSFGHVVAVCMDYQSATATSPQTALMRNAVFLRGGTSVKILAYDEYATPSGKAKVDQEIGYAAMNPTRTFTITPLAKYGNASAQLSIAKYDVFLMYDQTAAPTGQMATVGTAWHANSVLDSFVAAGGVVIVLSGGTGEMDQFLSASQLLDVSGQTVVTGSKLYNRSGGLDALGQNVITPFLAPLSSCTFTTAMMPDINTSFVLTDTASGVFGAPAVVHRAFPP